VPVAISHPSQQSSGELPVFDPRRADEVQRRHTLLAEYLDLKGLDALLLRRPENISWFSCGAEVTRGGGSEPAGALFITREARLVLCNNIDSPHFFEGTLSGMGFQLKERPWEQPCDALCHDLTRGRRVGGDVHFPAVEFVGDELADFRLQLGEVEFELLTELGRDVAHAVEATARTCESGETESEIAGQIAHRLTRHQVIPARVQVISDGRGKRFRHWGHSEAPVRRFAILSAFARRNGLHVGVTRTVSFGDPPGALVDAHQHASLLLATGMFFAKPGWSMAETWKRVARIYEKFGAGDEWRTADQGTITGYSPCERPFAPGRNESFAAGQVLHLQPSVREAAVGDTILLQPDGAKTLTVATNWPMIVVQVKGAEMHLPAIFRRDSTDEWAVG